MRKVGRLNAAHSLIMPNITIDKRKSLKAGWRSMVEKLDYTHHVTIASNAKSDRVRNRLLRFGQELFWRVQTSLNITRFGADFNPTSDTPKSYGVTGFAFVQNPDGNLHWHSVWKVPPHWWRQFEHIIAKIIADELNFLRSLDVLVQRLPRGLNDQKRCASYITRDLWMGLQWKGFFVEGGEDLTIVF